MATPNKSEILAKALEMWKSYQYQRGCGELAETNPEPCELAEDGFLQAAQSELMSSPYKKYESFEQPEKTIRENEKTERLQPENFADIFDVDACLRSGLVLFGGSGCGKSTLGKAIVRKLSANGITSYIVDSSRAWTNEGYDVIEVSRSIDRYEWNRENTVFDVAYLTVNEKTIFANTLAGSLMDDHISGTVEGAEILVLEEAELFLSNNSLRSHALENLLTLVSTGRNFNVRFIAISQVPSGIDKLPIKLCEQRFFGRLSEPNDVRYVKQILPKESVEQLKRLETGCFIAENKGKVQRFKLEIEKPLSTQGFTYSFNSNVPVLETRLISRDSLY